MGTLWQDIRYGLRQLRRSPGFTFVAILTLAIGIGANMAIFSFVKTVLLDPLPAHDSDQLVQIRALDRRTGRFCRGLNPPTLNELYQHDEFFSELVAFDIHSMTLQRELLKERAVGRWVTPNFFNVWDVVPQLGRTFVANEGRPDKNKVVVLSHAYWKSHFGARADIIGETIHFNEIDLTVVGVMPPHFRFPSGGVQYWVPQDVPVHSEAFQFRHMGVIGRFQPGVTLTQTQALLDTIAARHARDYPVSNEGFGTTVRPLRMMFTTEVVQKTLLSLMGVVGFILLIACANLANLLFARTENRKRELAIRSGLGAGKLRLIAHLLTENVILAIIGGLFGLLVTYWSIEALTMIIPADMPRLKPVRIDFGLFGITLLFSVAIGIAFGLAPAWIACRGQIINCLKQAVSAVSPDRVQRRLSNALVVSEVALAVVLLSGAGLMISSVVRLLQVDVGYDPTNLVRFHMALPWPKYQDLERKNQFLQQLHERWSSLPGVDSVGIGINYLGQTPGDWTSVNGTTAKAVTVGCGSGDENFLKTFRAHLVAGRHLEQSDAVANQKTIVVNKLLAQLLGIGDNPLGQTVTHLTEQGPVRYEVVGVMNDARYYGLTQELAPICYRPYQAMPGTAPHFMVVRTTGKPSALLTSLRRELKLLEPTIDNPYFDIIEDTLYNSTASHRVYMKCLVSAAAVAISLAAMGIYGVLAYSVTRRTKEMGIRMALGALPSEIIRDIMRQGMGTVLIGICIGLTATFWLSRFIEILLFDMSRHNPFVLAGAVAVFIAVAALATWIPARRAARIDPMEALRYE